MLIQINYFKSHMNKTRKNADLNRKNGFDEYFPIREKGETFSFVKRSLSLKFLMTFLVKHRVIEPTVLMKCSHIFYSTT